MSIKSWPKQERPREKLLTQGEQSLSDAELIAIFLRIGVPGKSALQLARQLLTEFHGLRGLLNASEHEFCRIPGLGAAKYAQLKAALEIGRRYLQESLNREDILKNPHRTKEYLLAKLRDRTQEVFAVIFLDSQNRIIRYQELFFGTINGAAIYPREVVSKALQHNAARVIIAHNHPSGVAEPSPADIHLTKQLQQALALIDVQILDHLVIGDGEVTSLVEKGLI